jgi:hypothetical protein
MYSLILNICFITVAVCLTLIMVGVTILMAKDFKDDMR